MSDERSSYSVLDQRWEIVERYLGDLGLMQYDQATRALHSLRQEVGDLVEQFKNVQREAEHSERYAEERDLVAQKFEDKYEALRKAVEYHLDVCSRSAGVQSPLRQALYAASEPS